MGVSVGEEVCNIAETESKMEVAGGTVLAPPVGLNVVGKIDEATIVVIPSVTAIVALSFSPSVGEPVGISVPFSSNGANVELSFSRSSISEGEMVML